MQKYRNCKTVVSGEVFDSLREANRYRELLLLQRAGEIEDLKRQVKFLLIPAQYEHQDAPTKRERGKCLEREVAYIADFVYKSKVSSIWEDVVEDTKGVRTKDYIIKRKLMLYRYGIRIQEV